jgi:hypothetical protein
MKAKHLLVLMLLCSSLSLFSQITLTLQPGPVDGIDAHMKEIESNVNFGSTPDFIAYTWTFNSVQSEGRSLIKFDLSMLPINAIILDAKLSLYHNPTSYSAGHSGVNHSFLKVVTGAWNENTVTWATMPPTTSANAVYLDTSSSTNQNYLNIDITSHIASWHASPATNHGFMIENVLKTLYRSMKFCSSDHPTSSLRPKLVIVYDTVAPPPSGPCPGYKFLEAHICKGDSVWLQNGYRKNPGHYFDTLTSASNQDTIVVTALYVHQPASGLTQLHICKGDSTNIGGIWQKSPGLYPLYWITALGCDSIEYVQLSNTILDSTITSNGSTLTANQSGAFYQWLDCGMGLAIIPGATSQSFTPAVNGSYAVMIIKDGCMAISPCMEVSNIMVPQPHLLPGIKLHPNPTTGHLVVDIGQRCNKVSLLMVNAAGQRVYFIQNEQVERVSVSISHLPAGVYSVVMNLDGVQVTSQIVKQ